MRPHLYTIRSKGMGSHPDIFVNFLYLLRNTLFFFASERQLRQLWKGFNVAVCFFPAVLYPLTSSPNDALLLLPPSFSVCLPVRPFVFLSVCFSVCIQRTSWGPLAGTLTSGTASCDPFKAASMIKHLSCVQGTRFFFKSQPTLPERGESLVPKDIRLFLDHFWLRSFPSQFLRFVSLLWSPNL